MNIRLKDIIDLDYLISIDDALESKDDIKSRAIKDRKIYSQFRNSGKTNKAILFSWLESRKTEFFQKIDTKREPRLPGSTFSFLYTWMAWAMAFLGGISGISLSVSFLVYHGTRPINVSIFIALFIVLQIMFILLTLIVLIRRKLQEKNKAQKFHNTILHTLLSSFFFTILTKISRKADGVIFKKNIDTLEYTASLLRVKTREYDALFFWPFFILTSIFAFCFSAGALGGILFRVIVSDMAFGWQSTLMATSETVHDMVSFMALPWSWCIPQSFAHPSLDQIEGSRMILKEGISVLATQDLVSWWPFLCLGILFYVVLPRGILLLTGILAQKHILEQFNFQKPRYTVLISRMQSPEFDIDSDSERQTLASQLSANRARPDDTLLTRQKHKKLGDGMRSSSSSKSETVEPGQTAVILASKSVYSDEAMDSVIRYIEENLFWGVKDKIGINFDGDADSVAVQKITTSDAGQVILVHEVWQPPIRGLLHYITQIRSVIPQDKPLWILLTADAGQNDLSVKDDDMNFQVWEKTIFKLENPGITVKRFIK